MEAQYMNLVDPADRLDYVDGSGEYYYVLVVNLKAKTVRVEMVPNGRVARPNGQAIGRVLVYELPSDVDAIELGNFLKSDPVVSLLNRMMSSYTERQAPGGRVVGDWATEDAELAAEEFALWVDPGPDSDPSMFPTLPDGSGVWSASDWYMANPIDVPADASERWIHALAIQEQAAIRAQADAEGIYVRVYGIVSYLADRRAEAQWFADAEQPGG